ncbi:MAG: YbaK/EbsC family protein [Sulfitobacter sp.]
MSKSLKRVRAALETAGLAVDIRETALARTAADAADAIGCHVDQIAKSIVFKGESSGLALVFVTKGGSSVDLDAATECAGEKLGKADPALIRAQTGFAIGGVSPIGHVNPTRKWFDAGLMAFDVVWAAAGTPHHVFGLPPKTMLDISEAELAEFTSKP